jgi:TonB-dependent receptor
MKTLLVNTLAASALIIGAAKAVADDELVIYVFKDGNAASGLSVKVDGSEEKVTSSNGAVTFDLNSGGHSVQLLENGNTIHSFRFDTAAGQLTDINVLIDGSDKKVAVESFFKTESPLEKSKAPKGTLSGTVKANGEIVSGATVTIDETGAATTTAEDGSFSFELPRGIYTLVVDDERYDLAELPDVRVVSNVTKGVGVTLREAIEQTASSVGTLNIAMPVIEEMTVMGTYNAAAFETSERFATNVVDTMDIEAIARFGDSDVSASVIRMPSVTVQEDNFVFIRGLGGRYVTTTLNGATMPGTNPQKRSVPLDLFPSNMVSQLDVKKTFEASMPGESTGGNLVINTRTFPDEFEGKLSFSLGYNSVITGESALTDPSRDDSDWLGFDDGTRSRPAAVRGASIVLDPARALGIDATVTDTNGNEVDVLDGRFFQLSPATEQELRRSAALLLTDTLEMESETASPNTSFGLQLGNLFYVGDQELGFYAAVNYRTGWSARANGERNSYSPGGAQRDDFDFEEYNFDVNLNGLFSIGYVVGNNSFESNTIVSRVSQNSVRESEGIDGDAIEPSYRYRIRWEERQFLSQQIRGEHILGGQEEWTATWQATASQAQRFAPDRREVQFNQEQPEIWALEISELIRRYDDLLDNNFDGSVDIEWLPAASENFESTLKLGAKYIWRDRDAESSTYGFRFNNLVDDPNFNIAPNRLVSDVINQDNITGDSSTGLAFDDKTLLSDSYTADMTLNSAYFSYDLMIAQKLQFVLGARYEDFELNTRTFELSSQRLAENTLAEDVLLPSFNVNWIYSDTQQLRFAYTETVSRPDFRERSTAVYFDDELDARVRGNENLENSDITNFDLRWELYWGENNNVSVAGFYKDISNAIERVVQPASGTAGNTRTFRNVEESELYGVELDSRIEFPLNDAYSQSLFVTGNLSLIESEVVDGGETKPLQGAPEYSFNLVLGWDDLERNQELTVLFNQNGETTVDRGVSGAPDVIVEPIPVLDMNYKKFYGDDLTFTLKIQNLLDAETEWTQGGQTFLKFNRGTRLTAGVDWRF